MPDYKLLLVKYIEHVVSWEGTTFLEDFGDLTPQERADIRQARYETKIDWDVDFYEDP